MIDLSEASGFNYQYSALKTSLTFIFKAKTAGITPLKQQVAKVRVKASIARYGETRSEMLWMKSETGMPVHDEAMKAATRLPNKRPKHPPKIPIKTVSAITILKIDNLDAPMAIKVAKSRLLSETFIISTVAISVALIRNRNSFIP